MVGNANFEKNKTTRKNARQQNQKPEKGYTGKTWERTDKRSQYPQQGEE
jgi:hypothetical protein